jgi:hypothetical protein
MPRRKMRSNRDSEVGAQHVPAVKRDDRARWRVRNRDEGEVEAVRAALVGAPVEAADTTSARSRSRGKRCGLQALVRPASVSMRRSACLSRTQVSNPASQNVISKSFCLEELVFKQRWRNISLLSTHDHDAVQPRSCRIRWHGACEC